MKTRLMFTWVLLLTFSVAFAQHPRNVMIYNITSTDCGPCSCMDSIYKNNVLDSFPNTIIVAFHGIGSGFKEYQGNDIVNYFPQKFEPSGFPDGLGHDVYYLNITDTVAKRYEQLPETPIAIEIESKIWDPVSRTVDLSITMRNDGPELPGDYWFNVIVTEDNIKHTHRTMDSCSTPNIQGLPFDTSYFNNWVTRSMIYYSQGDSLTGPSWPEQQTVTRSSNFLIDNAWIAENCNVVVNVYKKIDSLYKSPVQQVIKTSITSSSTVPDEETLKTGIIKVYPNPATDISNLHFSISSGGVCSLNIYDLKGNKFKNFIEGYVKPGLYNVEIQTQEFPNGTYLIVLETDKGKTWEKMVIVNRN